MLVGQGVSGDFPLLAYSGRPAFFSRPRPVALR